MLLPKMKEATSQYCFIKAYFLQTTYKSGYINALWNILPQDLDETETLTSWDQYETETLN